jgi:poly(A) polymerase
MLEIVTTLAHIFRAEGKELFMVGGTVRDLLLHRGGSPDIDLTTNARPEEIRRLVNRTDPVAVIVMGEQFGTIRVHYARQADASPPEAQGASSPRPASLDPEPVSDVDIVEITTYRSDVYASDSRKPEVTFGDRLEDDLLRRDFTINAMALDPLGGDIIDPWGGQADLAARLVRAVGNDPERRFDEDPLRMLRAARFAAQLGFTIEPATAHAMGAQSVTLGKISRERIRDEFTKLLVTSRPSMGLRLLVDLDLMPYIVPEVLELRGVSQAPAHSKDVYEHVLRVVERNPSRPASRWAGLLHDIAKPRTKSVENGKVHFYGHEDVGAVMARDILRRLKFDKPFIDHVSRLVKLHMRANSYLPEWTDGAVRRMMLDAGDAMNDLLDLSSADITSYRPEKVSRAEKRVEELRARCQWLREEAERVPLRSPLDGNDLMALFGREPGAWIRPIKDHLLNLVIDEQLSPDDREGAEREARHAMDLLEHGLPLPAPQVPPAAPPPGEEPQVGERKRQRRAAQRRQSRAATGPGKG